MKGLPRKGVTPMSSMVYMTPESRSYAEILYSFGNHELAKLPGIEPGSNKYVSRIALLLHDLPVAYYLLM